MLSFYGDGFLEIPPQANAIACDEFAISILLFKAANENKPKRRRCESVSKVQAKKNATQSLTGLWGVVHPKRYDISIQN